VLAAGAGDLAGGTSSASTKLIHGGLRYLEHYEFALVRESLSERERLWAIAPHIAGRCVSSCRMYADCARAGCSGSAC
jgi:glycerol-3-phosphate dehydrogenase